MNESKKNELLIAMAKEWLPDPPKEDEFTTKELMEFVPQSRRGKTFRDLVRRKLAEMEEKGFVTRRKTTNNAYAYKMADGVAFVELIAAIQDD
mgnify:CR=1 FL=1